MELTLENSHNNIKSSGEDLIQGGRNSIKSRFFFKRPPLTNGNKDKLSQADRG